MDGLDCIERVKAESEGASRNFVWKHLEGRATPCAVLQPTCTRALKVFLVINVSLQMDKLCCALERNEVFRERLCIVVHHKYGRILDIVAGGVKELQLVVWFGIGRELTCRSRAPVANEIVPLT